MGRYRPPAAKKSPYITEEGHQRLSDELEGLWIKRREVVAALSAAAAEGDRSENAEYIYRKKQLGGIDYRIRYLQKRLDELKIVDNEPSDPRKVFFGAWVELEDEQGEIVRYRIVGPDEFDEQDDYISLDSPVAKALLGKSLDDEVVVQTPKGKLSYLITCVDYI
ncbi:MAG: transcription elongation factor GreB [Sulfuriflexus sp.]|nr:transcription elongation factor GreB [Sulfuriflexus sp.]